MSQLPGVRRGEQKILETPFPPDYLEEWTKRLAVPAEETASDFQTVLVFRLGEEWLGLPVSALLEVTTNRVIHRVPHREGLLAGVVNIRGELQLCVRLDQVIGIKGDGPSSHSPEVPDKTNKTRLVVVESDGDRWVFPVDEVDEVFRFPKSELSNSPATLARSGHRLTQGVFHSRHRSVGLIDDARLFQVLRGKIR